MKIRLMELLYKEVKQYSLLGHLKFGNVKELSGTTCKVASSSWQPGTTFKM